MEIGRQFALFGRFAHFGRVGGEPKIRRSGWWPRCNWKWRARIEAGAGSKQYGILGLLLRLRYRMRAAGLKYRPPVFSRRRRWTAPVSPSSGGPLPLLDPELQPLFAALVKRGFSQRRKMMFKLLKQDWPQARLAEAFRPTGPLPANPRRSRQPGTIRPPGRNSWAAPETKPPMNDEMFDIVNDRDEVIGRLPRRMVHRDGHKHRAVHVLVFDSRGRIFLQKRSLTKDTFPGAWDSSASGHLESGEDYAACAARELREELGWSAPAPPRPLFKIAACAGTGAGICLGLSLRVGRPLHPAPRGNRARPMVHPGRSQRLAGPSPRDFAILHPDLEKMDPRRGASDRDGGQRSGQKRALKVSLRAGDKSVRFLGVGRGSQVVRHGSAKAVCVGSIPTPASTPDFPLGSTELRRRGGPKWPNAHQNAYLRSYSG